MIEQCSPRGHVMPCALTTKDDRPLILFLGCVRAGEYEGLLRAGMPLGLLRDTDSPDCAHVPEGFAFLDEMPFGAGREAVAAKLESICATRRVACLVTLFEGHVELGARVSAELGFAGLAPATASVVRDKTVSRQRLADELGLDCTGRYAAVERSDEALGFADRAGYPVVVKPRCLYGSLYVTLCTDPGELTAALGRLLGMGRTAGPAAFPFGGLHIEEYLPGTNHSVDVISLNGTAWPTPVIDVITGVDLGGNDFHHFARVTPSALTTEEQRGLVDLAVSVAKALEVTPGVAHVELIQSAGQPRVIEVGGRPGGNRHRLLDIGRGIDLCRAYVDVLTGRPPTVDPVRNVPMAIATPYPSRAGILRAFRRLDLVRELASVRSVVTKASVGQRLGTAREGGDPPLSVELVADSRDALMSDLARLAAVRDRLFDLEQVASGCDGA